MKYALGNMLNGAGGLNADQLALDLQFAADKTLTARRGPTPVLTRGSSATFVGSNGLIQSAGNNVARFDHDPVTLASRGLLIEEGRTNQSLYSGALVNNVGWSLPQATSVVSGTGPDGNNAYEIADDTAVANVHGVLNTGGTTGTAATSVVSGTIYTGSIFLKKVAGSVDWVQLTLGAGGFGTAQYANFNLATGQVGNSAGLASGTSPRIEAFPNGWYRCSISVVATTTTTSFSTAIYSTNNTNPTSRAISYNGNTANKFLASLCQFEAGSFATSYIPTTTSALARSADVCSITGADFTGMYNQPEGTLFANVIPRTEDQRAAVLCCNTTTSSNLNWIFKSSTAIANAGKRWTGQTGTVSVISTTSDVAVSQSKLAYGYKADDYAFAYNNSIVGTDTSGAVTSPTAMRIGHRDDGLNINGHIAAIRYYRKRLANAKLASLTV